MSVSGASIALSAVGEFSILNLCNFQLNSTNFKLNAKDFHLDSTDLYLDPKDSQLNSTNLQLNFVEKITLMQQLRTQLMNF